eukprot:scaffold2340_cov113-Isochrysis_galbana.AAC.4
MDAAESGEMGHSLPFQAASSKQPREARLSPSGSPRRAAHNCKIRTMPLIQPEVADPDPDALAELELALAPRWLGSVSAVKCTTRDPRRDADAER